MIPPLPGGVKACPRSAAPAPQEGSLFLHRPFRRPSPGKSKRPRAWHGAVVSLSFWNERLDIRRLDGLALVGLRPGARRGHRGLDELRERVHSFAAEPEALLLGQGPDLRLHDVNLRHRYSLL